MSDGTLVIPTAAVFEPLLAPNARYLGAKGGRGSGKSHFFAGLAVERSVYEKVDIVCIREVQRTLKQSVKKLVEAKISDLNAGYYFDVQDSLIKSRQGGVIIFEGMQNHTADSIKSLEGYGVAWVEEAQTLSQRSLDLLRPTIRASGSQLWFSWNPTKPTDPVDALLCGENPPPGTVIVTANYYDNPWLPAELKAEIEYDRARDPDKFDHIWGGGYERHAHARVFKNWTVEEFERPAGTIFRQGADWGFATDPSVLVRVSIEGNRLYIDYEAWAIGCEIVNLPELFMSVPDAEKWPITADSARPETISHMQKNGFPKIRAAIKGAKSLEDGVEFLKGYDIVVHPRCKHVIDELQSYKYKTDELTGEVLPVLEDKDNHTIDAIRYACEGARRAGVKPTKPPAVQRPIMGGWMSA